MFNKDAELNISSLKERLARFRDERDWMQFHKPKDLAMAISIESGELLERFLWKKQEEIDLNLQDNEKRKRVVDEFADVVITAINFANALNIDIASVVLDKIEQNDLKYPADKARGTAKKYTEL